MQQFQLADGSIFIYYLYFVDMVLPLKPCHMCIFHKLFTTKANASI